MENTNELKIESSFSMKLKPEDKERTEVKFTLDFSLLSREEIAKWAEKEVGRGINNEIRDGKKKVEDVQGKVIEVKKLEKGERGKPKITEEMMQKAIAEKFGVSLEVLQKSIEMAKKNVSK